VATESAISDQSKFRALPWRKRIAYGSVAVAFGLVVAAGIAEIAVRLMLPQQEPMRWMLPSERYGHVMKPDFHQAYAFGRSGYVMDVETNASGYRDRAIAPKQPGERTVLFLGDSFAFGHAIDVADRFDTVLKTLCDAEGLSSRFINTAVGGWGTLQQTRYARDHFSELEPDIVVLTFCGNDPSDDVYFQQKGQSFDEVMFPGKVFLRNHSHLYRFLNHRAFLLLHRYYLWRNRKETAGVEMDSQSANLISDVQWNATAEILERFHEDFIAYNPNGKLLIQATSPTHNDTQSRLSSIAEGFHARYVDLSAETEKLPPEDRRLPYDAHWSPAMHRVAAHGLFAPLRELLTAK
jgi:hypothetical protein